MKVREYFVVSSIVVVIAIGALYFVWPPILWSLLFFAPLILLGYSDIFQKKHAIKRNFPVIGNMRYLLEFFRPEIMQYFVETDTEGRPINRLLRNMIYERSKGENDTTPFGTQLDVYQTGYEWLSHSIYIKREKKELEIPRITVGGKQCKQPYSASILNISAMSYGS